jgi:hypothetical protein
VRAVATTTTVLVSATSTILVVCASLAARATRVCSTAITTAARLFVIARLPTLRALRLSDATLGSGWDVEVFKQVS